MLWFVFVIVNQNQISNGVLISIGWELIYTNKTRTSDISWKKINRSTKIASIATDEQMSAFYAFSQKMPFVVVCLCKYFVNCVFSSIFQLFTLCKRTHRFNRLQTLSNAWFIIVNFTRMLVSNFKPWHYCLLCVLWCDFWSAEMIVFIHVVPSANIEYSIYWFEKMNSDNYCVSVCNEWQIHVEISWMHPNYRCTKRTSEQAIEQCFIAIFHLQNDRFDQNSSDEATCRQTRVRTFFFSALKKKPCLFFY